MRDFEFKALNHYCDNYTVHSQGQEIEKNYSPDYVLENGNNYIIIEHETEPNRKTIIADIFKAGFFLKETREGILIIVMTPKGTSSFESYQKHVLKYFAWLKSLTNLKDVYFVLETDYLANSILMKINDEYFLKNAISLNSMLIA